LDKSLWSPDAIGDIVVEVYKLRTEWGQGGDLARMEARDSPETIRKNAAAWEQWTIHVMEVLNAFGYLRRSG
jgi:hypothetical protein